MLAAPARAWATDTWVRRVAMARARTTVLLLLILVVAGVLRVYRLSDQPVFIDEDLYTVAVVRLDSFSPRSIGRMAAQVVKPPLPLLSQALLARATRDAVTAGRLQSACAGLVTTLLTYFLGRRLGRGRVCAGLLAASVYALSPVAVLHERLVLQDGLLTAAALGAVLIGWSAVERTDSRGALWAAGIGFLAVQMKLPGVATAAAPGLALMANLPLTRRRAFVAAIATAGPCASYLFLRLSPLGPFLTVQDDARLEILTSLRANSDAAWDSARTYFPAAIGALVILGILWIARMKRPHLVVVLGMVGVWVLPWLFLSNFAPSRYYLPAVPYVAALAGVGGAWLIDGLTERWPAASVLARMAVIGSLGSLGLLAVDVAVDRPSAHLSQLDDWQYRSGWPSGGVYASAADLVARASEITGRVYMINQQHLVAAGALSAAPGRSWVIGPGDSLPPDAQGELYVMIDNVGVDAAGQLVEQAFGQHLDQLRQVVPSSQLIGFFPQADSAHGVAVVRIRLS